MPGIRPTRRFFVRASLAAGGALALGFRLPGAIPGASAQKAGKRDRRPPPKVVDTEINAWLVIASDETVTLRIARAEMGQGILTGLAQLAAEELDCDWSRMRTAFAKPGESLRRNRPWGDFATSNSRSLRGTQAAIREAGAAARSMLLEAAALEWGVPRGELQVEGGVIRHAESRRQTTFGRLAVAAAALPPPLPGTVPLKPSDRWRIVGQSVPSLDAKAKIDGSAVYGIDVRLPGMLSAAVAAAPVVGGKLAGFDGAAALAMPGVKRVMAVGDDAVAVVADSWWQAHKALEAVGIDWARAPGEGISSDSIQAYLKGGLETPDAFVDRTHGDALAGLRGAAQTLEAVYATPFLHHATLEPMNATALWQPDRLEVWAPTQNGEASLRTAAEAGGLAPEACEIHRTLMGGGFGRRLRQDFVRQAVLIAREFPGVPVKLIWSREEDTTHGHYRPVTQARLRAGLDDKGDPTGLIIRISGQSILTSSHARVSGAQTGRDPRMFQGLHAQPGEAQMGYSIANLYVDHAMRNTLLPVGSWRGVHTTQNGVYLECFIDEMAHAAKRDPLEFRRSLMKGHLAHLAVLSAAAGKAGWGSEAPPGIFRGLAQMMAVGSYAAAVAEVSVDEDGSLSVERVVIGLDCGNVVNPRLVEAQLEGAVAMALSATLHEEITIKAGRVVERNFDTYRLLRLAEMPKVETILVPSGDFWGGVGEAAIGCVPPAILNAIFAATGRRIRTLPLRGNWLR